MFKRRKIGSVNTLSPAQQVKRWLAGFTAKIFFIVIATAGLYFFFQYVILGILNFLAVHVLEAKPIAENNKIFLTTMIIAIILVDLYILKERIAKR